MLELISENYEKAFVLLSHFGVIFLSPSIACINLNILSKLMFFKRKSLSTFFFSRKWTIIKYKNFILDNKNMKYNISAINKEYKIFKIPDSDEIHLYVKNHQNIIFSQITTSNTILDKDSLAYLLYRLEK